MSDFFAESDRKPRTEYARLLSIRTTTLTDEQIAKAKAGGHDYGVQATLQVEWEPLSYNYQGGKYGNRATDFIPMSFGDLSRDRDGNPTPQVLEAVRTIGYRGIPESLRVRTLASTPPESANRYYERWMARGREVLGMHINDGERADIPEGQIYSANEGKVFEIEEGPDFFPEWNPTGGRNGRGAWDTKKKKLKPFTRYPVKVVENYVAPESPRIIVIESDDTAEPATTVQAGGPTVEKLKTAVGATLAGTPVAKLTNRNQQVAAVGRAISESAEAAVLGHQEVQDAANDGALLAYLEARGVISTAKGLVEVA